MSRVLPPPDYLGEIVETIEAASPIQTRGDMNMFVIEKDAAVNLDIMNGILNTMIYCLCEACNANKMEAT